MPNVTATPLVKVTDESKNSQDDPKRRTRKIRFEDQEDIIVRSPSPPVPIRSNDKGGKSSTNPEWLSELTDTQVDMFKEVFDLLDTDSGGTIDAKELYICLKDLDIGITEEEISSVLGELDADGNGEIDFDEFLFAMTATDRYLDSLVDEAGMVSKYTKRQSLFFTAITKFAMKNSLGEISRYYAQKAKVVPHVISHYTAGARLIGLTDRQLARHLKDMQAAIKDQDSPYAKPLQFVIPGPPNPRKKKDVNKFSLKTEQIKVQAHSRGSRRRRRTAIHFDLNDELLESLRLLAQKGSVVAMLPDAHLLPQLRRLAKENGSLAGGAPDDTPPPIRSSRRYRDKRPSRVIMNNFLNEQMRRKIISFSGNDSKKSVRKFHGWTLPPMERENIPLPSLRLNMGYKTPTIEDLPVIREKVVSAINEYYSNLRKRQVRTACKHWDALYTEEITSSKLHENFSQVYRAYSPIKSEDCFVICPWIPSRRCPTPALPESRPHSAVGL